MADSPRRAPQPGDEEDPRELARHHVSTIAANVRRLAAERDLALAHLADYAGIGRTTIWRLLDANDRGPSDPRLSTLTALAVALEVDITDLLRPDPTA